MELQKSEHHSHELIQQQIGELQKWELARAAKKIGEAGEEEIRQALRYAMVKIGLRAANFPAGAEKFLLIRHVHENFPENAVEEIKIAFDWAISGRLEEDYNCFENFSCAYFSRIMNAYNRLANAAKPEPKPFTARMEERRDDMSYEEFLQTDLAKKLLKHGVKIESW